MVKSFMQSFEKLLQSLIYLCLDDSGRVISFQHLPSHNKCILDGPTCCDSQPERQTDRQTNPTDNLNYREDRP